MIEAGPSATGSSLGAFRRLLSRAKVDSQFASTRGFADAPLKDLALFIRNAFSRKGGGFWAERNARSCHQRAQPWDNIAPDIAAELQLGSKDAGGRGSRRWKNGRRRLRKLSCIQNRGTFAEEASPTKSLCRIVQRHGVPRARSRTDCSIIRASGLNSGINQAAVLSGEYVRSNCHRRRYYRGRCAITSDYKCRRDKFGRSRGVLTFGGRGKRDGGSWRVRARAGTSERSRFSASTSKCSSAFSRGGAI